ncbi:MAG: polysaccharide biosynthesis protein, partial [Clostridia bacterium]|nr:polysaccharide biosynthesis protein [Clostridia bacterium]
IAKNKYKEAHEIFKNTFTLLIIVGLISSFAMFFGADFIISSQNWPEEARWSLYGLAFAPFFVAFMGAFRGYFQGMQNMTPTAVSQLIESFLRVIVGVGLAAILLKEGLGMAAGGASFGATAGAIGGALFLSIIYLKNRKKIKENFALDEGSKKVGFKKAALLVIGVALPITLGAAINSVISLIDSNVIVARLISALGLTEKVATSQYGILSGKATTLINVPLTISSALVLSIMPAISEANAKGDKKEMHEKITLGLRLSLLIALPAMAGLAALATPIMTLLYGDKTGGGDTLAMLSLCLVFVILGQLFAAILQGMGKFYLPILNLGIAAVFKYILTYILVGLPALGVNGAALATVITYMIYAILNFIFVKKYSKFKLENKMQAIYKPVLSTFVMLVLTIASYSCLSKINMLPNKLNTLVSVGVAGLTYVIMLLVTKTINEEDYDSIPGGTKIRKILKKFHLV